MAFIRYTGFTKAGTRIPADKFSQFKQAINSIDEVALKEEPIEGAGEGDQTKLNDQVDSGDKSSGESGADSKIEEKAM